MASTTPQSSRHSYGRANYEDDGENMIDASSRTSHYGETAGFQGDMASQSELLATLTCLYYHLFPHLLRLLARSSLKREDCSEGGPLAIVRYQEDTHAVGSVSDYAPSKAVVPQQRNSLVHDTNTWSATVKHSMEAIPNDEYQQQDQRRNARVRLDNIHKAYTQMQGANIGHIYGATRVSGNARVFQGNVFSDLQQGPGRSHIYGVTEASDNGMVIKGDFHWNPPSGPRR